MNDVKSLGIMDARNSVAYYRVSTVRQGKSGLGLEAQQHAVHSYISNKAIRLDREFVEIESRKKNNRPILNEALRYCTKTGALLIIAKLDRLSGNVAFISALMESKVEFVAVDNPNAKKLFIHIMAAFAEDERERISARTKEALAAAKRKGVVLGSHGRDVLSKENKERSIAFAKKMKPILTELENKGFNTIRKMTKELNRRKVPTYQNNGSKWHVATVHKIIKITQK